MICVKMSDLVVSKVNRCRCGRVGQVLDHILGREDDVIVTPDGRHIGRLSPAFHSTAFVKEVQVVQVEPERLVVRIVPISRDRFDDASKAAIRDLRSRVGEKMRIDTILVDHIERTSSGKFRAVISQINQDGCVRA